MLDRDIMTVPVNDIPEATVLCTYLGGELVMQKKSDQFNISVS